MGTHGSVGAYNNYLILSMVRRVRIHEVYAKWYICVYIQNQIKGYEQLHITLCLLSTIWSTRGLYRTPGLTLISKSTNLRLYIPQGSWVD